MYKGIPEDQQVEFAKRVAETRIKDYKCPSTEEEYWQVIDTYWVLILDIMLRFCEPDALKTFPNSFAAVLTKLKEEKNKELCSYIVEAWCKSPDTGHIHLIPGWEILCDLCSENHLLDDHN